MRIPIDVQRVRSVTMVAGEQVTVLVRREVCEEQVAKSGACS